MLIFKNRILAAAALAGLVGGAFVPAYAQQAQSPPAGQQQQEQQRVQTNVPDEQLEEFVQAHSSVQQIYDQYQGQAATVQSQDDLIVLQQQANEEMVQAIEQSDLSLAEYNQIASAIQFDPDIRDRYIQMAQ